jgi:glycerol-1-phosphatase
MEGEIPRRYGSDAVEIKGSRRLLDSLKSIAVPWAIVTSGTKDLVLGWLQVMNLPPPALLITAEDVTKGKPDPEGYLKARRELLQTLKMDSEAPVLVFEDSPAGIKAGTDAGCHVLGLATSHSIAELEITQAKWLVKDLESVRVVGYNNQTGEIEVEIRNSLERRMAHN